MSHDRSGQVFVASLASRFARIEKPISSLSLVGGFVFDALTLKRIDLFWENFWVVVHLLAVAVFILLLNRREQALDKAKDPASTHFWLINALQFAFGGLLSTFLVFYFRSGSIWISWPFFMILGAAFIANESLKKHYARLDFQLSFFFLSLYSFDIFLLPVVLHSIGPTIFLLSGALSLALLWGFLLILVATSHESLSWRSKNNKVLTVSIVAIFVVINALYFLNVIPPIPLSLKDASIHHAIERNEAGNYVVQSESQSVLGYFRTAEQIHLAPGLPLYAYTAIFSPTRLNTDIVHTWQFYEPRRGWTTQGRTVLPVRGGRDGGYRTFSMKSNMRSGAWRVKVETPSGALLGRLRFNVIGQSAEPTLVTSIKN